MAKAKPIKGVRDNTPLLVASERMIETRLAEMLAYESYVANQEAVYELHQMRIAAKRLRYTLEIFQDAYDAYSEIGPQIKAATKEIEQIQEYLGSIHDADVLVPQLNQHLAHLLKDGYGIGPSGEPVIGVHNVDYDACLGLITVCRQLRTEREKVYDKFLDRWRKLQLEDFFASLRRQLHDVAEQASSAKPPPAPQSDSLQPATSPDGMDNLPSLDSPDRLVRKRVAAAKDSTGPAVGIKSSRRRGGRAG